MLKVTKKDVFEAYPVLAKLNIKGNIRFNYTVAKVVKLLEPEFEALQKANQPDPKFLEVQRHALALQTKLQSGQISLEEYERQLKELEETNADVIQQRQKQIQDFEELLKETVELDVKPLKLEDLPEDLDTKTLIALEKLNLIEE